MSSSKRTDLYRDFLQVLIRVYRLELLALSPFLWFNYPPPPPNSLCMGIRTVFCILVYSV
jgi:hypothetical protein